MASPAAEPTRRELITLDGVTYDMETGEVVEEKEPFIPDTQDKVEWLLERMQKMDADLAALAARRTAVLENIESMRKEVSNRRAGLEYAYRPALEKFARAALESAGGKSKTWKCPFAKISFRATKGTNKIVDMEAAVAWATAHNAQEIVKVVSSVNVTDLITYLDGCPDKEREEGRAILLESSPPGESVTIKTGVE